MRDALRIILVRHGETEANRQERFAASDDVALTEYGHQQARAVAAQIREKFCPTKVFSSNLYRARQTAAAIGKVLGIAPDVLPGVHERDFGILKGQLYSQMGLLMARDPVYQADRRWLWVPEQGESLTTVRDRAVAALVRLQDLSPEKEVVVVAHGAVMECISAHLTGDWETACVPLNCGMIMIDKRL